MNNSLHLNQNGFSLLEILVAFSILSLSIGVLMQIFSTSLNNTEISRDKAQAVMIAQSLLASVGTEILPQNANTSGAAENGFKWRLESQPVKANDASTISLWEVTAIVEWGEATPKVNSRNLTLHTMRIQLANTQ